MINNITKTDKIMTTLHELKAWKEEKMKPLIELQDDRMERYYNCQDDTLYGGSSWNATQEKINSISEFYNLMEQQITKGYVKYEFIQTRLFDLQGNRIESKLVMTKFGQSWVTSDGVFIGCAKKLSTLEKKGFTVKTYNVILKCQYNGGQRKDYNCIYGWRPVFVSIDETLTEIQFDGNHYLGLTWI